MGDRNYMIVPVEVPGVLRYLPRTAPAMIPGRHATSLLHQNGVLAALADSADDGSRKARGAERSFQFLGLR